MLQIDHVYEFLYQEIFKEFDLWHLPKGVPAVDKIIDSTDIVVFTSSLFTTKKIFFYDQEPIISAVSDAYMNVFNWTNGYTLNDIVIKNYTNTLPYKVSTISNEVVDVIVMNPNMLFKQSTLVTSEHSAEVDSTVDQYNLSKLYYFFHGFAALDWYRGFYALNYSKQANRTYAHDYVSYNRIITEDRSYRIYWVSKLKELDLLKHGQVSFNVTDNVFDDWRDEVVSPATKLSVHAQQHAEKYLTNVSKLTIDHPELPGSASADIPRAVDALWNVVTETVFYYNKLHLTEKIFKPIVSKQPFMLLAAPGNLAYLRSYGFKTFDGIIDESYDLIQDNDQRVDAVVAQLAWYCRLSAVEKQQVIEAIAPIVEYNFHHFYGEFKHIITRELLDNSKALFKEIGYDDSTIAYESIYKVLTN